MADHDNARPSQPDDVDIELTIDTNDNHGSQQDSVPERRPAAEEQQAATVRTVDHFEIHEQIGQGGMGTVYRAFDTTLLRDVAIKVLGTETDAATSSQGRQRFLAEAQITGQLQHPGIPPVHELGTLEDGRPFLAMKLVKGRTLHELLRARKNPAEDRSRFIAIFEQICHAIGYAHSHNVIHRDLKPANVMVGAHGEVQVMDWGLAKVIGEAPAEETVRDDPDALPATLPAGTKIDTADRHDSATRTGQALGTPAYMAPEQAGGEIRKLDARCDVFGLGAVLCEILTGKPPYQGASGQEVLLQAVRGGLDDALQRLESCTDEPELVELCRRCLAFDKNDRPADGNAVAAEVTRIREAAESRARQAELEKAESLVREAEQRKRRRQILVAAVAVVLVLAIGVAGTTVGMWRAERSRQAADAARQTALERQKEALAERDAKAQALAKLEVALESEREAKEMEKEARTQAMAALRFMTDDAVKEQLAEGTSHLSPRKKEYLQRVIEFYEGFGKIRGDREESQAIRAEGLYRVGKLQNYLGEPESARENLEEAVQVYRQLATEHPDNADYRLELARSLGRLSWVLMRTASAYEEAERSAEEAIAGAKKLVAEFPRVSEYASVLASSYRVLGSVFDRTSRFTEAEKHYKNAIAIEEELAQKFSEVPEYKSNLARSRNNLGGVYYRTSRYAKADEQYKKAMAIQEELAQQFPSVPMFKSDLAGSRYNLGGMYFRTSRHAKAVEQYKKANRLFEELAQQFSNVPMYKNDLARSRNNLGNVYYSTSRFDEAEEQYKKAIAIREELAQQFSDVAKYKSALADTCNNLGHVYYSTQRYEEAKQQLKKSIAALDKLVDQQPDSAYLWNKLCFSCNGLVRTLVWTKRYDEAQEQCSMMIRKCEARIAQHPDQNDYQRGLAGVLEAQTLAHAAQNHRDEAMAAAQRLAGLTYDPKEAALHASWGLSLGVRAVSENEELEELTRKESAELFTNEAIAMLRTAIERGCDDVNELERDPDYDAIRDRPEFQKIIDQLKAAKPDTQGGS